MHLNWKTYVLFGASWLDSRQCITGESGDSGNDLIGVLNPNFRPFSFELRKKLDFLNKF